MPKIPQKNAKLKKIDAFAPINKPHKDL